MANKNRKRVRELKKSRFWTWLIFFTILIVLTSFLVSFFISVYSSNFISGKLDSERDTVQHMLDIYESCTREGTDSSTSLNAFSRNWFILDKDRNIKGSVSTCGIPENKKTSSMTVRDTPMNVNAYIYDANVYPDIETPVITQDDDDVIVYVFDILSNTDPYVVPSDRELIQSEVVRSELHSITIDQENMIRIPFWIGLKMSDEKSEFIAQSFITIDLLDLVLVVAIVASICLLVMIGYVVMIINLISGVVSRRKTLHVFFTDAITQGFNYVYFLYKAEDLIRKYRNLGIRYHVVNLRFVDYRTFCVCHSIKEGEEVLAAIYRYISNNLDKRREICAHASDADFALLLRGQDADQVRLRLQAIMDDVSHIKEDHVFVFQAGIDTLEPVTRSAERKAIDLAEIYNTASAAREALASEEPGISFFDEELIEDRRWAEAVQEHQQAALDNEEFVVYYQPKYDPRTDELLGAEALIRWQSPEFGFVPPGRMIPIFEKNGFITEIDHYMISHVARDQKKWLNAGFKCVPVSVNVSRAHFIESDLAEQIRDAVDAEGAPHEYIEIELTESAFFDDKKALIKTIERLKSYGFTVSMDDFGSGYSSLNSLKDMPLDVLKLDAEFFRGEDGGRRGEIVVTEAIRLAKKLNMRTVAEGVELRGQVDFLASLDCDMIQGYFYAKPMPGEDYEKRMRDHFMPKED